MKSVLKRVTAIVIAALMMAMTLAGCGSNSGNSLSNNLNDVSDKFEDAADDAEKDAADIDVDKLKKSADKIKDLDLTTDVSTGSDESDNEESVEESDSDNGSATPKGDLKAYSFADVYQDGNDITVIPNGGLNANTELFSGKDLDGFLDYVDSEVLEAGRTINRDFFYDLLSINLIDKDLSSSTSYIMTNMMVCLAVANNFHDTDVRVNSCHLDSNNAADYHYNVTAYGKDDTWLVNYQDRTFYMNDGKTEYHSTMFNDEYLSVWLVAMEEYYGVSAK